MSKVNDPRVNLETEDASMLGVGGVGSYAMDHVANYITACKTADAIAFDSKEGVFKVIQIHGKVTKNTAIPTKDEVVLNLTQEFVIHLRAPWYRRILGKWKANTKKPCRSKGAPKTLFRSLELFAYVLPKRVRTTVFEPAFFDEMQDYLLGRRRFRSRFGRAWLSFCFSLRIVGIVAGSFWGMCGDKLKRAVLHGIVDALRRAFGG